MATRADAVGYRWLLATLLLLLVPVAFVSVQQITGTSEAGRIATRPPADLFAKPVDGGALPISVGRHLLRKDPQARPLPQGQHHHERYSLVRLGTDSIWVTIVEGRITSLGDYEAASGLRDIASHDRFSCGWMDRQPQCVGLLRGGYVVTIAEPDMPMEDLALFSNRLYARLPAR
ncbi:MAG: hypothetical protein Q4G46_07190 [Propionibacteriaceae bacterium]|nr:hypothetical protein [Propionibacteriaceae bacterium]